MTPRFPPPAHRCKRGPPRQISTNFRRRLFDRSKNAFCTYATCMWRRRCDGVISSEFRRGLLQHKTVKVIHTLHICPNEFSYNCCSREDFVWHNASLDCHVALFVWSYRLFSRWYNSDLWRADGHATIANIALSWYHAGKIVYVRLYGKNSFHSL